MELIKSAKRREASYKTCCLSSQPLRDDSPWNTVILNYSLVEAPPPPKAKTPQAPVTHSRKRKVDQYLDQCQKEANRVIDAPEQVSFWRGLELRWTEHALERIRERGIPQITHLPKDCVLLPIKDTVRAVIIWYLKQRFVYVVDVKGNVVTALWPYDLKNYIETHT